MGRFGAVRFGTGELAVLGRLAIVFLSPEFSKTQKKQWPTLSPNVPTVSVFQPSSLKSQDVLRFDQFKFVIPKVDQANTKSDLPN